jgi:hypothetical protein
VSRIPIFSGAPILAFASDDINIVGLPSGSIGRYLVRKTGGREVFKQSFTTENTGDRNFYVAAVL